MYEGGCLRGCMGVWVSVCARVCMYEWVGVCVCE